MVFVIGCYRVGAKGALVGLVRTIICSGIKCIEDYTLAAGCTVCIHFDIPADAVHGMCTLCGCASMRVACMLGNKPATTGIKQTVCYLAPMHYGKHLPYTGNGGY